MDQIPMKNQAQRPHNTQSGSIFIWIFVMIALFGALSYAMMQSSRTGAGNLSQEKVKLAASEMMEYANSVRDAVKTLRIDGVPTRELDFRSDTTMLQNGTMDVAQNNNCTSNACRVFSPGAGGVTARQFFEYGLAPTWWDQSWSRVGTVDFTTVQVEGLGTSLPELAMNIVSLHPDVCHEINKLNGITKWPISEDTTGEVQYYIEDNNADTALAASDAWHLGEGESQFVGKNALCLFSGDGDTGMAYFVLEAR